MTTYLVFTLLMLISTFYAIILQVTSFGRWLAAERTWLSVVIGVGYVTLFMRLLGPAPTWWLWLVAWGVAGAPLVARSLWNELRRDSALWRREVER